MSIPAEVSRQDVWRLLQEHRKRNQLSGEGRSWKEASALIQSSIGDKEVLSPSALSEAFGVEISQVDAYWQNIQGRGYLLESRLTGFRMLFILGVAILLSFGIFVALMMSTPKKIEGESAPLMEGKPRGNPTTE